VNRYPGLGLAAAFAVGISIALISDGLVGSVGAIAGVLLVVGLLSSRVFTPPLPPRLAARLLLFVLLGSWRGSAAERNEEAPEEVQQRAPVVLEGTVVEPPVVVVQDRYGVRTLVTLFSIALGSGAKVRIRCDGRTQRVAGGDRVALLGTFHFPRGRRNPGDLRGNAVPSFRVEHPGNVWPRGARGFSTLSGALGSVRGAVHRTFKAMYRERTRGFVLSLLLGDRRLLTSDVREALRLTGTYHLLAISGLHVYLIMFLVLRIPLPARIRLPARLLFLAGFALLTGARASVMRAALMFSLGILLEACGRSPRALNTLGWTTLILLGMDPLLSMDIGFQLSCVAVLAILTWGDRLSRHGTQESSSARFLVGFLAVSVGTTASTAPLIALYFHRLHLFAPLWNLVAYPLALVTLVGGLLSLALGFVHPHLGFPVAYLVDLLAQTLLEPLVLGARLPGSAVTLPPPSSVLVAATYVLLTAGLFLRIRRAILLVAGLALPVSVAVVLALPRPIELWTFDCGACDTALLTTPGSGALLIDAGAGGTHTQAGATLTRAIVSTGSRVLSGVFLTHAHADHTRGLRGVWERLRVEKIWVSPFFERSREGRRLARKARGRGLPVRVVSRGSCLRFARQPELRVDVLYPHELETLPLARSRNDTSLALRVSLRQRSILFLGDLEEDGLSRFLSQEGDLQAEVLIAPHHGRGNRLWPVLIERVRPRDVIISGTGNGGARELAAWLETLGIRVWATWRRGAIRTVWSEERGWVPGYWWNGE